MRRIALLFFSILLISGITLSFGGTAMGATKYCVGDSVVPGGISAASGVVTAYQHPRVSHVLKYFGISQQDVNQLGSQAVNGTVTKSGNVKVNGQVVATHAISAGCGFIPGSTKVNDGYMTFYTRPTSVSFAQPSLSALVVMKNHRFAFAILNSCGNPVKATPVTPKVTKAKPAAPTQTQTQTQTQTVVVNNIPPQVKSAHTTAPPAATLPNTGPGDVLGISGLATVFGSAGHYIYSRRRRN